MNKEDLKVGMVIEHIGAYSRTLGKPCNREIIATGDEIYLYRNKNDCSKSIDYLDNLDEWRPKAKKKKITMYRYTYYVKSIGKCYQTEWQSVKDCTNDAAATETKGVWVNDEEV